jgi:tetratricopeptide (TPR) repeat protein
MLSLYGHIVKASRAPLASFVQANFGLALWIEAGPLLLIMPSMWRLRLAMRLRTLRLLLLPTLFVAVLALPPAFAQSHNDAKLKALGNRVTELYQAGQYGVATALAEQYAAAAKARYGENAPEYAIALNNLAALLEVTNRLAEAEPLLRRALAIAETSFRPDHPEVASPLNNLAQLLQATNRLAEAVPLMRRALAINEKSFGPEHPQVATSLNNLATLLRATNRLSEAEPLMRRALAIDENSFGPEHPDVAKDLINLAGVLQDQGRWLEAVALFRKAKPSMTGARAGSEPERGGFPTRTGNASWSSSRAALAGRPCLTRTS